ncbi:sensor histidine kinase [Clostridium sp.]|uniref:sensor histidine kinase n=1 Tax=Clostridium sp. TaxID=1506 RepID=UPI003F2D5C12
MNTLIDKFILFIMCFITYIPYIDNYHKVVLVLIAITFTSLISYTENLKVLIYSFTFFLLLSFFNAELLFFSPLIFYDLFFYKLKWPCVFFIIPILINFEVIPMSSLFLIIAYSLASYVLASRTKALEDIKKNYYNLSDKSKELSMVFEEKNKELLEKQDYEINLATLRERNRIARDIHDNVGHLLSRSILQIAALLAVNKNDSTRENLTLIKNTLSEAMDSIRSSVHDLHEESINLNVEIQKLIDNFNFCNVKLEYNLESSPKKNIKYCFITITKEALSNIIKHSNATEVWVSLYEHPALYQLIIKDNGHHINLSSEDGIGLKNIKDRVTALGGNVNISIDNGFRIFISIPKI